MLTYVGPVRRQAGRRRDPPRAAARRARSSTCTTGWRRSTASAAARSRELVPEARVAVAHGQMNEDALEQVIVDFWDKRVRRPGLHHDRRDRPRHLQRQHADRRPRPTRSASRSCTSCAAASAAAASAATPTSCTRPSKPLTETAHDRLATIAQHTELGAGMAVAMKDLEIRGAGNMLGAEQTGHIAGVGFDLYVRLVGEAVAEFRRPSPATRPSRPRCRVELPVDAHIPHDYVPGERLRLEAYSGSPTPPTDAARRRGRARSCVDRYGELPGAGGALLEVARFRVLARRGRAHRGRRCRGPGSGSARSSCPSRGRCG